MVVSWHAADPTDACFAQVMLSGSGAVAHVPMQPGPGGAVRPGWFTNLYSFDLLDDKIEQDLDATGSTPSANSKGSGCAGAKPEESSE